MADGVGVYRITGSLEAGALFSSSLDLEGDINVRRPHERRHYNGVLRGDFASFPDTSLGGVFHFTSSAEFPPSWTQYFVGKRHAFVISAISSSDELVAMNAYLSGS